MKLVEKTVELRKQLTEWRRSGSRIALVPTMGNLHEGHLSLVGEGRRIAGRVVVSLFVNPTQFVAGEDYDSYPRTFQSDQEKLAAMDVDILFHPSVQEIYPEGSESQTKVSVPHLDNIFCGKSRPGHFSGVATVVTKLFNIIRPDVAIFGEKDYQQLLMIRQLVKDLYFEIEIVDMPTVREANGLAMSSRNAYLPDKEKETAATLYKVLEKIAASIRAGDTDFSQLEQTGKDVLTGAGFKTDYLAIADADTLGPPGDGDLVILAAAWLGGARLIDNVILRR